MTDRAAFAIAPGDRIPEHDETARDQEEVFVDGGEHPAPAGTFARVDPELSRIEVNAGDEPSRS
jgi:hypothetical protein